MIPDWLRLPLRVLSPQARERLSYFIFPMELRLRRLRARTFSPKSSDRYVCDDTLYRVDPRTIVYSTNIPAYIQDGNAAGHMKNRVTFNIYEYRGKVIGGDWDRLEIRFDDCEFFRSYRERAGTGKPWERLPYYEHNLSLIDSKAREWRDEWGCRNRQELDRRCRGLDVIFDEIRWNGYRSRMSLKEGKRKIGLVEREDEVAVNIGRLGDLLFNSGRHRLTFARIAGIPEIPVRITVRHEEWEAFKEEIKAHAQKHGGRVLYPLTHIDLRAIPSRYSGAGYDIIRRHVAAGNNTLLDLGAHWGYFCHRFELEGFRCTAVEENRDDLYFLRKLKRAENREFDVIEGPVSGLAGKTPPVFNVVLALDILSLLSAGRDRDEGLKALLKGLVMNEMYVGLSTGAGPQVSNTWEDITPEQLTGLIVANSCLNNSAFCGEAEDGLRIYKFWR